ncbi:MAG: O-antigen ligase family protein [Clostridiales bacterium]|nr:O-antigen ligase family protein [Clostridiales bacterium]
MNSLIRRRDPLGGTDLVFAAYFTTMFCLYTVTYIQLAAQLSIVAYVLVQLVRKSKLRMKTRVLKHELFLLVWLGAFVGLAYLSQNWAYGIKEDSNTLLTLFRILIIGIAMFLYVDSYPRAVAVMKALIFAVLIMSMVALVTTPLSQYGQAGEEGFAVLIGQQRNTFGAAVTPLTLVCLVFARQERLRWGKVLSAFFLFALVCSGSRGAMLQYVIIVLLYVLFQPNMKKRAQYIAGGVLLTLLALLLLQNIPFLYDTVLVRFQNLILTLTGENQAADKSSLGRSLYQVLAAKMFLDRPWLGYGVDGFYCMLRDVRYVNGVFMRAVYSHSNFSEISADFGIVGLAVWYLPIGIVWLNAFRRRKQSQMMNMVFVLLTSMLILDYARIPWSTHISMYFYFCLLLLYFYLPAGSLPGRWDPRRTRTASRTLKRG